MNLPRIAAALCVISILVPALVPGAAALAGPPPEKVALVNARIITVSGDTLPSGTLLIEHGKITAIGTEVEVPFDAVEVDLSGKVLFPGMVDPHSASGLDARNEPLAVSPFVDVADSLDPSRLFFEESLRGGVTSVHVMFGNDCVIGGVSRLVHPIGRTPDEMTQRPGIALKVSTSPKRGFDRMLQMATLRETFRELEEYLDDLAEKRYEEELEKKGEELTVGPEEARKRGRELIREEDLDDRHRNLVRLTSGKLDAWIYCGDAMDVGPAVEIARKHGFFDRSTFVLGTEAYRAVDELRKAGRPVVLPEELVHRDRDPITGELTEVFVAKVLHDAGIKYALQPNTGSVAERYLNYQAARCVRHGIPRQRALAAITMHPAEMLGVADRIGSLEVGKIANVVVLSGDPLEFDTWVEQVYIRGVLAYERGRDPRLRTLLGDAQTAGAGSAGESQSAPRGKDDGR